MPDPRRAKLHQIGPDARLILPDDNVSSKALKFKSKNFAIRLDRILEGLCEYCGKESEYEKCPFCQLRHIMRCSDCLRNHVKKDHPNIPITIIDFRTSA